MKQTLLTLIIGVFYFNFNRAQNLVPDPGFEKNKFVPTEFSAINASSSWSRPSGGTSDLFCKCDRKTKYQTDKAYSFVDVPLNAMGNQQAHSGTCYGGLFAHSHGDYREYLQTYLSEPLKKNMVYRFQMYLSLADYSRAYVDQLGVCFTKTKLNYASSDVITDLEPMYIKVGSEIGDEVEEWHLCEILYKAMGGETHLLIGSFEINELKETGFKAPKEMRTRINQNDSRDAYYYVDDVSLEEIFQPEDIAEEADSVTEIITKEISPGTMLVMKNVLFLANESIFLPSSYPELDAIANALAENPAWRIKIFGHTDNSGNEKANKKLSFERAKAVAEHLIFRGINSSRISYEGFGSEHPVADNTSEQGKQLNRRVEFKIEEK
ncbi:MAG: OmpA family protein [Bacteroidia bacterium]|nr:OmpA family protein [Bacteroidia bacterium]